METLKQKQIGAYEALKGQFGYTNKLASPRIQKVVVSVGTGSGMKKDKNRNTFVIEHQRQEHR
jgi:ribosomal protein L5